MKSILKHAPDTQFLGNGGKNMEEAGATKNWVDKSAVMGVVEVLKMYKWFKAQLEAILEEIKSEQPDCLILIDYPKFNLTLAKKIREAGIKTKIIYYISPKVWAWNKKRVPVMAELLDKMICIFPFEVEIYQKHNLPTVYVGNPLVDQLGDLGSDENRDPNLIGLFPGSREREVSRLFPTMVDAALRLHLSYPNLTFQVPAATEPLAVKMREILAQANLPKDDLICIKDGGSQELMRTAHAGVIASGTATLEAAYLGLPYCLVYKIAMPTYLVAKLLVKIEYIGLVNILAGEKVIEEYIQGDADAHHIERALEDFIKDPKHRGKTQQKLLDTARKLGDPGVHDRAAQEVLKELIET